jgi:hypothetical protein
MSISSICAHRAVRSLSLIKSYTFLHETKRKAAARRSAHLEFKVGCFEEQGYRSRARDSRVIATKQDQCVKGAVQST